MILAVGAVWAAPCAPVAVGAFRAPLDRAEAAYAALDPAGFQAALDEAALALTCLAEPLPSPDVARWHGLAALQAYVRGDLAAVSGSLAAAQAAEAGWTFPSAWVPEGHELRSVSAAPPGASVALLPPAAGSTWVDGHRDDRRPTSRPAVFQLVDERGAAALSLYLLPADGAPVYPVAAPPPLPLPVPAPAPVAAPARGSRAPAVAALVGGVALAGVSGGAFAAASSGRARFDGPTGGDWTIDDLTGLQRRVNASEATAWTAGGLAIASFAVAGVTWTR